MSRRTIGAGLTFLVLALLVLSPAARAADPPHPTVRVFAAASLADAFAEIGKAFEHMEANKHLGKIVVTM